MIDVIKQLAGIPLFAGLSKAQYEALARIGVRRSCRKGERIFSEGDEGTGFYVVVAGRVKIFKVSADGKEQILHLFGPGESFGEVSVFTGQGFPADAVDRRPDDPPVLPEAGLQRPHPERPDPRPEHDGPALPAADAVRRSHRGPVAQGGARDGLPNTCST